jgi:hypothetical protein
MWTLWRRGGWLARVLAIALLLVALLGAAYLFATFQIITRHPAPPPLELLVRCPPLIVSAFAGSGGLANPVPSVASMAEVHDQLCAAFGRQRALTGLLLAGAGVLNAAAVLEWARAWRRSRRRRRRAERASARTPGGSDQDAPVEPTTPPSDSGS